MERDEILAEFRAAGALLEGHFLLSSGLHSDKYFQCARVMMDAERGARLCAALAERVRRELPAVSELSAPELIVSPAMGGVVVGYELGRQLGLPSVFLERVDGRFTLRRGFAIAPGTACLVVEDIITTGGSAREACEVVESLGGIVTAVACLIDRSEGVGGNGVGSEGASGGGSKAEVGNDDESGSGSGSEDGSGSGAEKHAANFNAPLIPLARVSVAAYPPDALPPHLRDTPATRPGSRGLQ